MPSKVIILIIFTAFGSFTIYSYNAMGLADRGFNCNTEIKKVFTPWSSGCLFSPAKDFGTLSRAQIQNEKALYDRFADHGGVDPDISWQRFVFLQYFMKPLRLNFKDTDEAYRYYLNVEHTDLDRVTHYLAFLQLNQLQPLAQMTLDEYCDKYIPDYKYQTVEHLETYLEGRQINLNLEFCYGRIDPRFKPNSVDR